MSKAASLYRAFDADGALLYVGISLCAATRLHDHKTSSSWYELAATITIEKFGSKDSAYEAECEAIRAENPMYNRMRPMRASEKSARRARDRDGRMAIRYAQWKFGGNEGIAKALGISARVVRSWTHEHGVPERYGNMLKEKYPRVLSGWGRAHAFNEELTP